MLSFASCLALFGGAALQAAHVPRIETSALLREIPSRVELARLPLPACTLEHSSRALRWEEREGRREAVLAEAKGPGVFVRLWLADPRGRLRLYLGDKTQPALVVEAQELFAARGSWPALRNSALALARLPFPFANGARLTLECPTDPDFELVWRSYPEGTAVADWSAPPKAELDTLAEAWDRQPRGPEGQLSYTLSLAQENPAGDFLAADPKLCAGPRAVSEIVLRVEGQDPELALRSLVLHMRFDGEETVVCPVSTFFRCAELEPRIRAQWTRDLAARWIMPYRERMDLSVENLGPPSTHVSGAVYTQAWTWDERSLHFGARWIGSRGATRLSIEGQGLLLGIVPGSIPRDFPCLVAQLDGVPQPLRAALALLDRAPFGKRLEFELPAHEAPEPQRVAIFYVRPGARITSRDPQPSERESLATDR
jgi:hypothetical protein